ncbi:hypothetical protein S40293_11513 [Stachybotrys chartarum IBT 40293]|nr:hypothetical protein S40293_11513 [Stachybotrys chartarum IBT 40293]
MATPVSLDTSFLEPSKGGVSGESQCREAPSNQFNSVHGHEAKAPDELNASSFSGYGLGCVETHESLHTQETTAKPGDLVVGRRSHQEWPLPNAMLKCAKDNSKVALQLEYSWGMSCVAYRTQDTSTTSAGLPSSRAQGPKTNTRIQTSGLPMKGSLGESDPDKADEVSIYTVKRILARWKKGFYFLRWSDSIAGWEPKKNILNKQMLHEFKKTYKGFNKGFNILDSRTEAGKCQSLMHWHGHQSSEDSWVAKSLMSPDGIDRYGAGGLK